MVGQNGGRIDAANSPNYIYGLTCVPSSNHCDVLARMRLEAAMATFAPMLGLRVVWRPTVAPAVATTLGSSLDGSLDAAVQRRASVWRAHKR
jgi:hypothetical protein